MMRRSASNERGSVVVMALVIMMICTVLIGIVLYTGSQASQKAAVRRDRVVNVPAADNGLKMVQTALRLQYMSEGDQYTLTTAEYDRLVNRPAGERWVANTDRVIPQTYRMVDVSSVGAAVTVEVPLSRTARGYWQLVRVVQPDYVRNVNLVVYIRSWSVDAGRTSKARTIQAELRPGLFSDYQMLVDGPIEFGAGAVIQGRVHSNGMLGGNLRPPGDRRIWSDVTVTCSTGAELTTTRGSIAVPGCGRGYARAGTGKFIDLASTTTASGVVQSVACPMRRARCVNQTGSYRVYLEDNRVRWSGAAAGVEPIESADNHQKPGEAILFNGDVVVSGTVGGRLTIIARNATTGGGAAQLTIARGGSTTFGSRGERGDVLGLMAQGNVVIDTRNTGGEDPCQLSLVRAAMVSESGTVGIDDKFINEIVQRGSRACSSTLRIEGSMAAHASPLLYSTWGGDDVGYRRRRYHYPEQLRQNPPPFFPLTYRWELIDWRDANENCLDPASTGYQDPGCQ